MSAHLITQQQKGKALIEGARLRRHLGDHLIRPVTIKSNVKQGVNKLKRYADHTIEVSAKAIKVIHAIIEEQTEKDMRAALMAHSEVIVDENGGIKTIPSSVVTGKYIPNELWL